MIGNVQILQNDGTSLISNGLAHFILNDSQKQYIIYSLGEQREENLIVYIGLENAPVPNPGITETDGAYFSELLRRIGRDEDVSSELTFLPLTSGLYYVNDTVKKIAIPNKVSNNLIALQQQSQIKDSQENVPVIKDNSFFDSSMVVEPQVEVPEQPEQSIFSQPMQPTNENPDGGEEIKNQNTVNVESDNGGTTVIPSELKLENEELITDEQAKNAINAVEEAQKTIAENVKLIKLFISQQNTLAEEIPSKGELTQQELVSENVLVSTNDLGPTDETGNLFENKDIVNNIELAPQPVPPLDALGEETELSADYGNDGPDQIVQGNNYESTLDSTTTEPQVAPEGLVNQAPTETVQYIDTTLMMQDGVPADSPQQMIDTGIPSVDNQYDSAPSYIDTTAMVQEPQKPESEYVNYAPSTAINTGVQMETQEYTNNQPLTIDTGITGQNIVASDAPVIADNSSQFIDGQQNYGFATQMPQLEVQDTPQQFGNVAPVILPDGQTQGTEQSLVLTPDSFKQAA